IPGMRHVGAPAHSILVSLPRPKRELPRREPGSSGRFESIQALVCDAWKDDREPPLYAWIRHSLSVGTPLNEFVGAFRKLEAIQFAFGRRVFVHPVRMDHHTVDLADFDHMADPETGTHEVE